MTTINLATEAFNTKQVCAITGISRKQAIHWDTKGIVRPSVKPASGRGSKRLYSYADLLALSVVKSLNDLGISLQKVGKCVRYLRNHFPDISQPLNFCTLVTDGVTIQLLEDEETLIDTVTRPRQRAWARLSISQLDRELRNRVVKLTEKRMEEVTVGEETYQVEVYPDEECGGYVAEVAGLPGCVTNGDTLEEVLEMAEDAIRCWEEAYEALKKEGITVPRGKSHGKRKRA